MSTNSCSLTNLHKTAKFDSLWKLQVMSTGSHEDEGRQAPTRAGKSGCNHAGHGIKAFLCVISWANRALTQNLCCCFRIPADNTCITSSSRRFLAASVSNSSPPSGAAAATAHRERLALRGLEPWNFRSKPCAGEPFL